MKFLRLAAATTLLAAAGFAAAQGAASAPAAAPAVSPAKKELAQKLVQLQQGAVEALARQLAEQPLNAVAQQAGAVLQGKLPPEQREAAARDIQAEMKKFADEIFPMLRDRGLKLAPTALGSLYEERFSEDELRHLIGAFDHPAYRKYQQLAGEMQRVLAEKLVNETRSTVEPRLRALQDTIGKRLGLSAPPAPAAPTAPAASRPAAAPKAAASAAKK